MKQVRTRHSKEFKVKAVELSHQRGNVQRVADELSVNVETLRVWRKAFKEGRLDSNSNVPEKVKSKEELELARLRKEIYEITLERDILKKAVGIFSKSDR